MTYVEGLHIYGGGKGSILYGFSLANELDSSGVTQVGGFVGSEKLLSWTLNACTVSTLKHNTFKLAPHHPMYVLGTHVNE